MCLAGGKDICKSHIKERECNEARAVTRVKEDPKYFFRYAIDGRKCSHFLANYK